MIETFSRLRHVSNDIGLLSALFYLVISRFYISWLSILLFGGPFILILIKTLNVFYTYRTHCFLSITAHVKQNQLRTYVKSTIKFFTPVQDPSDRMVHISEKLRFLSVNIISLPKFIYEFSIEKHMYVENEQHS